mmetsp:Transcript_24291/g.68973  ORF Transcript_24291/g.68973 Transcript_24291/m.68973 type:complete len:225 (+) Transcript_24291:881-1555(+)
MTPKPLTVPCRETQPSTSFAPPQRSNLSAIELRREPNFSGKPATLLEPSPPPPAQVEEPMQVPSSSPPESPDQGVAVGHASPPACRRVGRLGKAPSCDTATAPAAAAKRRLSSEDLPSTKATAKAARKLSPAPVSSRTWPPGTSHGGCFQILPSGSNNKAPSPPRVTSTRSAPFDFKNLAAAITSASLPTGMAVSRCSSGKFGDTRARLRKSSSLMGLSSPPIS